MAYLTLRYEFRYQKAELVLVFFFKNKIISQFSATFVILVMAVLLTLSSSAIAADNSINQPPLKFERISIAEGLSQSYVYDIVQDTNGFIWKR